MRKLIFWIALVCLTTTKEEELNLDDLVIEDTDEKVVIDKILKKYFKEGNEIKRRDMKELITEFLTKKTQAEMVEIHNKPSKSYIEERIIYFEKIVFEFMQQFTQSKFTLEETRNLLENKTVVNFVQDIVKRNTDRHKTEHDEHHRQKKIYEQVEKHVADIIKNDEM